MNVCKIEQNGEFCTNDTAIMRTGNARDRKIRANDESLIEERVMAQDSRNGHILRK